MERPRIDEAAVIAPGAVVCGAATIEKDVSVWYHAVVRADNNTIQIGEGSNIQDLAVLHVDRNAPLRIGRRVTVGHGAILHGCTVEDHAVIGMGAIVLNGAVIGKNSMVAAGALVPQNMEIPENTLVMGSPAKIRRLLTEAELEKYRENAENYIRESKEAEL